MQRGIVLLGGTGFVGRAVSRALADKDPVVITRQQCDLLNGDQVQLVLKPLVKGKTVVVIAGVPRLRSHNFDSFRDNVQMIFNLINAFEESKPSEILFISSAEVYGTPRALPLTESSPLLPDTLYGVSKVACEHLLRSFHRVSGVPLTIIRPPGIFGGEDRGLGLIGKLVQCSRENKEFCLEGSGNSLRDYLFVDDLAAAVRQLCGSSSGETILNVAPGTPFSMRDLIAAVMRIHGSFKIQEVPPHGPEYNLVFDTSAAKRRLPAMEWTTLDRALSSYRVGGTI